MSTTTPTSARNTAEGGAASCVCLLVFACSCSQVYPLRPRRRRAYKCCSSGVYLETTISYHYTQTQRAADGVQKRRRRDVNFATLASSSRHRSSKRRRRRHRNAQKWNTRSQDDITSVFGVRSLLLCVCLCAVCRFYDPHKTTPVLASPHLRHQPRNRTISVISIEPREPHKNPHQPATAAAATNTHVARSRSPVVVASLALRAPRDVTSFTSSPSSCATNWLLKVTRARVCLRARRASAGGVQTCARVMRRMNSCALARTGSDFTGSRACVRGFRGILYVRG